MARKSTQTMTMETDVVRPNDTPDVLAYRVGQLEITTAAGLKEIKNELINLKTHFVTHDELEVVKNDIKDLKGWNTWAARLVFSTVILAVLGVVIAQVKL